jgi:hypothetical protein
MNGILRALSSVVSFILRDRSQTLEQYIVAHNPQDSAQVEELERRYNMRNSLGKLI